jgi:hypothetical protein
MPSGLGKLRKKRTSGSGSGPRNGTIAVSLIGYTIERTLAGCGTDAETTHLDGCCQVGCLRLTGSLVLVLARVDCLCARPSGKIRCDVDWSDSNARLDILHFDCPNPNPLILFHVQQYLTPTLASLQGPRYAMSSPNEPSPTETPIAAQYARVTSGQYPAESDVERYNPTSSDPLRPEGSDGIRTPPSTGGSHSQPPQGTWSPTSQAGGGSEESGSSGTKVGSGKDISSGGEEGYRYDRPRVRTHGCLGAP